MAVLEKLVHLELRGLNGLVLPAFSFTGGLTELSRLTQLKHLVSNNAPVFVIVMLCKEWSLSVSVPVCLSRYVINLSYSVCLGKLLYNGGMLGKRNTSTEHG